MRAALLIIFLAISSDMLAQSLLGQFAQLDHLEQQYQQQQTRRQLQYNKQLQQFNEQQQRIQKEQQVREKLQHDPLKRRQIRQQQNNISN